MSHASERQTCRQLYGLPGPPCKRLSLSAVGTASPGKWSLLRPSCPLLAWSSSHAFTLLPEQSSQSSCAHLHSLGSNPHQPVHSTRHSSEWAQRDSWLCLSPAPLPSTLWSPALLPFQGSLRLLLYAVRACPWPLNRMSTWYFTHFS